MVQGADKTRESCMTVLKISGGRPLHGIIDVPASKNASLALLSAVILGEGPSVLYNAPYITDVHHKLELLEHLGIHNRWESRNLVIDSTEITRPEADESSFRPIRTSFYLLGPLVARTGRALLPAPGGCQIGTRPVDLHLKGLSLLGIEIELRNGHYLAKCNKLKGAEIYLDLPSAGATQHIMSTATLAEGTTVIHNAAMEPEVVTLAHMLNHMGARIEGAGTSTITIVGVSSLKPCEFHIPADRVQASTYLLAGAITNGDVTVRGILPEYLTSLSNKLREAEAEVSEGVDWVRVAALQRLKAIKIKTMPYPGFATDVQQPAAALLATAVGTSILEETIYEGRIGHISELNKMGAQISLEGRSSIIEGVPKLNGAVVYATDLRAGAALCLAGLAASGETIVKNLYFVDRGYETFEKHLTTLGANIQRVTVGSLKKNLVSG